MFQKYTIQYTKSICFRYLQISPDIFRYLQISMSLFSPMSLHLLFIFSIFKSFFLLYLFLLLFTLPICSPLLLFYPLLHFFYPLFLLFLPFFSLFSIFYLCSFSWTPAVYAEERALLPNRSYTHVGVKGPFATSIKIVLLSGSNIPISRRKSATSVTPTSVSRLSMLMTCPNGSQ